jgi:hypothetical protein
VLHLITVLEELSSVKESASVRATNAEMIENLVNNMLGNEN